MKKLVTAILTVVLVLGLSITAFASAPAAKSQTAKVPAPYNTELKKLRTDTRTLVKEVKAKNTEVKELVKKAKSNKEQAKLKKTKELRKQLKSNRQQLKKVNDSRKAIVTDIKNAKSKNDEAAVTNDAQKIIDLKKQQSALLKTRITILDNIISVLK